MSIQEVRNGFLFFKKEKRMAITRNYDLSYKSIDSICNDINAFCNESNANRREAIKQRLLAEEALLQYRDNHQEDTPVVLCLSKTMFKVRISLQILCAPLDPFKEEDSGLMKSLTGISADGNHSWKYVKAASARQSCSESRNILDFSVNREKKINKPLSILLCIVTGFILGQILRSVLPAEELAIISADYTIPLGNAYTGLLCVMAILLIFFSIPLCMVQYGNGASFQKDVHHLLRRFLMISLALVLITFLIAVASFGINVEVIQFNSVFKPVFDIFISFVPVNLISPFLNFNCMQVLIIGTLFGIAFLIMGEPAKGLINAFDKINLVAVITNGYLTKAVGIYSGLMAFNFVITDTKLNSSILWIIGVTVVMSIFAYLAAVIIVSTRLKVRPGLIIKKFMPSFLVNLSSASVGASYTVFFDELSKDCGVEVNYTAVCTNVGTVIFKPMYSVFFAAIGFLLAAQNGGISLGITLEIIILAFVLPMAVPNIPDGASSIIIILLNSLAVAHDYSDTMISVNSLMQFLIVPLNVFILECVTLIQASGHNKLDITKLKKDT